MPDLVRDINGLLGEHNARRGTQRDAYSTTPRSYYAPSLMLSDQATNAPSTYSNDMSTNSSSTYMSSCFDRPMAHPSSVYSVPYRPSVPPTRAPTVASPLVCEFIGFGQCNATFDWDEEANWIAHIANDHLGGIFPSVSVCWFCNHEPWEAASQSQSESQACYRKRMHHIAKHFRNGKSWEDMRPDFYFVDHAYQYGLIDEEMFQRARQYHEVPQIPNLYPAGWRPGQRAQTSVQVETSRPRYRGSARSRAERYY